MSSWMERSQLLGRVLTGASDVENWPDTLVLMTDAGEVVWDAIGDCCSHSFFTDLKLNKVVGKRIVKVEDVESMVDAALNPKKLVEIDSEDSYDAYESIYGVKLTAEDGKVGYIVYRNHSNGYYGGWLEERGTQRWV